MSLELGLESSVEVIVTRAMTAEALGSGEVAVLGTPAVLGLVERAAVEALAGRLGRGETSVGASVELHHVAPTPIGAPVMATVRLASVDHRKLGFDFRVSDRAGVVARGHHHRVVVDRESFLASAQGR